LLNASVRKKVKNQPEKLPTVLLPNANKRMEMMTAQRFSRHPNTNHKGKNPTTNNIGAKKTPPRTKNTHTTPLPLHHHSDSYSRQFKKLKFILTRKKSKV